VLLIIVLTALTLITLDARGGRTGPLGFLGRGAHTIVSPIQGAVDDVANPVSDWWQGLTNSGDIKQENRALKDQLAAAEAEARANARAAVENEELRKQLGLTDELKTTDFVIARIRGGDVGNFDPTFTIDKGTSDGIQKDMPVISPAGLVGQVIDAWPNGAKVRTLTDPKFGITIVTTARPGAPAVSAAAEGNGSRTLIADFSAGTKLRVGDNVYSSALSPSFPANIPVGKIVKFAEKAGGTSVRAEIEPFVNLNELTYLTVLRWHPGSGAVMELPTTTTTSTTTTTLPFGGFGVTTTTVGGAEVPGVGP
jgi:rod shape-determining protein MreC